MGSNHIGVSKGVPRVHVRKKSQAFELTPGQTLQISILEKLNYLRGSKSLCENHRRLDSGSEDKKVLSEFQEMMRTKNVSSAPSLFTFRDTFDGGRPHPFELIRRFATANSKIIAKEVSEVQHQLSDGGTWALDLSISGLWSHLNHWGQKNEPLKVLCDESKPIRAMSGDLSGDKNDAAIRRAQNLMPGGPLGWETAEPIRFVDSRAHPSVQLADVIASTVVHSRPNGTHSDFKAAAEILDEGMLRDSIVPNFERVKLDKDPAKVHYAVLHEIVLRSEGKGTKVSIEDYFKIVEDTVKFGDFSI